MEDCLFCKIIAGEIPGNKVYEDDMVYAFYDIDPKAPDIERAVAAFVDSADVEGVAAANRSWAVEQYDYETQQRKLAEAYDRILRAAR